MGLRSCEVPIHFYKDREGRVSHHRRGSPLSSWYAGWVNLKAFFVHGATFSLFKPGIALLGFGLLLTLPLAAGPVTVGSITFSLHWLLLGITLSILGPAIHVHGNSGEVPLRLLRCANQALGGGVFLYAISSCSC